MKFTILTLFPDMIRPFLEQSVIGRAVEDGKIEIDIRNLRDWATDRHKSVDDSPYGGGPGMVLRVDVIDRALHDLKQEVRSKKYGDEPDTRYQIPDTILLTPQGQPFTQKVAEQLADEHRDLILIAGHYEGFDERIRRIVDQEISIGSYVLTGGELPAAVIVDSVARLLPGVLGNPESPKHESFSSDSSFATRHSSFDYPTYTRPEIYRPVSKEVGELTVPEILKSGDHAKIAHWRRLQSKPRTENSMDNG